MSDADLRTITIFYAWQSDREEACCKRFIRLAADAAAEAVGAKLGVKVVIDSDTEGVTGHPAITDTILRKIEACDLFLADMTFVGTTQKRKKLPNPNVMGEYGFALHAKGVHRLQLVMNTAFGPARALPFDISHLRHPAQYALAEGAPDVERRAERKRFAATLERNFEMAIREVLAAPMVVEPDRWSEAAAALQAVDLQPHAMPVPVIVSGPKLIVTVVPLAALDGVELAPKRVKAARPYFPPSIDVRVEEGQDETHWWASGLWRRRAERPNPETTWLFRLTAGGVMQIQATLGERIQDDKDIPIEGHEIERHLVSAVDRAATVAGLVGLGGPALVAASLEQIEDVEITRSWARKLRLRKPAAYIGTAQLDPLTAQSADQLKRLMDRIWLIGGWDEGSPFFAGVHWTGYDKA